MLKEGQKRALDQLARIAAAEPGTFLIEPGEDGWVGIGIDCRGFERVPNGVALRAREWFDVLIPECFPWSKPEVLTRHRRWTGTPHVQWDRHLCLYAAPSVEWDPSDGMYGFLGRLVVWLKAAACDELDPVGAPVHPPVAYAVSGTPMVIVRADTPAFTGPYWLGWAMLDIRSDARIDITGWVGLAAGTKLPPQTVAPAVLLDAAFPFEFPRTLADLFSAFDGTVFDAKDLQWILGLAVIGYPKDRPLNVVLGTAQRGTRCGEKRQHITVWQMSVDLAGSYDLALPKDDDSAKLGQLRDDLAAALNDVARFTKVNWCRVREARPEVTRDRAEGSSMQWFSGKRVAIWGCGALGSNVAALVVRAGASGVVLRDKSIVAPGVLPRQRFDDADLGRYKAASLAEALTRIAPTLDVRVCTGDVLSADTGLDLDWTDGCDLVIDATADNRVPKLTELRRRSQSSHAPIVTMVIGHTAERGLMTFTPANGVTGPAATERLAKIALLRRPDLRDFAEEFWPSTPRTGLFTPEPGCSEPTFTGSGTEVVALAALMLHGAALELTSATDHPSATATTLACTTRASAMTTQVALRQPSLVLEDPYLGYSVHIAPEANAQIQGWINRAARLDPGAESGGVLLGSRDPATSQVFVTAVLGPPPDSTASAEGFVCGIDGVGQAADAYRRSLRGAANVIGMWHTHPRMRPTPSATDHEGMRQLVGSFDTGPTQLLLIAGDDLTDPAFGAFMFERDRSPSAAPVAAIHRTAPGTERDHRIGMALSGGGSRAIAFHLGTLRALHDLGVLDRVDVISAVSGGSVIAAMYAYFDEPFDVFDARVVDLLRRGMTRDIARMTLASRYTMAAVGSGLSAGIGAAGSAIANVGRRGVGRERSIRPPRRRSATRTTAFEAVLRRQLFGEASIDEPARAIDVVLNAAELRGGNAFRFGSIESGSSRFGRLVDNRVPVARAVAASAAYPMLLPAIDTDYEFEGKGGTRGERVLLTDGGVFDNLGVSVMDPYRSPDYATNVHHVDYVISCDAGHGVLDTDRWPMWWTGRTRRSFESVYRKVQDAGKADLFQWRESGRIRGFAMPYLGMNDLALPYQPPDLVTRDQVRGYPTNFSAMSAESLRLLTTRGEQLTRIVVDWHCPEILR